MSYQSMSKGTNVTGTSDHQFLAVQKFGVFAINPMENFRVLGYRCLKLFPVPRILKSLVVNVFSNRIGLEISDA